MRLVLFDKNIDLTEDIEAILQLVLDNYGFGSRKRDDPTSKVKLSKLMLFLYNKKKYAIRDKKRVEAFVTVEQLSESAEITPEALYNHLKRMVECGLLEKMQMKINKRLTWCYALSGNTLVDSFKNLNERILLSTNNNIHVLKKIQTVIKNEAISESSRKKSEH